MAKKKADLLEDVKALGLKLTEKNTIAEISEAIKNAAENRLMYFFNLADEIYKIPESEKKNHTL